MNLPVMSLILIGLLAISVVLSWGRLLNWQGRAPKDMTSRPWRLAVLVLAQPLCAILLYFTVLPPLLPTEAGTLIVATRNAPAMSGHAAGDRMIALPESGALTGAERVPDLATALRTYPGLKHLLIVGDGLEARDREAVRGLSLSFKPNPVPQGVTHLVPPRTVAPGAAFQVGGQVSGLKGVTVELFDPADRRIDAVMPEPSGAFVLTSTARAAGQALFTLRVRDGQRKMVQELVVPVSVVDPRPLRVLILAGAPGPEVKYLRRWASDAAIQANTQMSAGSGLWVGDAPVAITSATLQGLDLVVLDERSWAARSDGERVALTDALRGGLGIVLRVTGPLSEITRRQWHALGVRIGQDTSGGVVKLPADKGDDDMLKARRGSNDLAVSPELTRRVTRIDGASGLPILRDDKGGVIALWRAEGRGRLAVWSVSDSFALVLTGRGDQYGEVWSRVFATVGRARAMAEVETRDLARAQERVTLCGVFNAPKVISPQGAMTRLLPDPAGGDCAAYWPKASGWHVLHHTDPETGEASQPFYVHEAGKVDSLHRMQVREATQALMTEAKTAGASAVAYGLSPASVKARRASAWPWFLAWLCLSASLWGFERARAGRKSGPV